MCTLVQLVGHQNELQFFDSIDVLRYKFDHTPFEHPRCSFSYIINRIKSFASFRYLSISSVQGIKCFRFVDEIPEFGRFPLTSSCLVLLHSRSCRSVTSQLENVCPWLTSLPLRLYIILQRHVHWFSFLSRSFLHDRREV